MAEISEPTRRSVLQFIAVGTAGVALSGCSRSSSPSSVPSTSAAAGEGSPAPDMIMMIRHAEKFEKDDPAVPGLTEKGAPDPESLIIRGWTRAGGLAELFAPSYGDPPAGLRRPTAVYSPTPQHNSGVRCTETVTPVAAKLGLTINDSHPVDDVAALAAELITLHGTTLVGWEHNHIPLVIDGFGHVTPRPPKVWADDRFDMIYVFSRTGDGWAFSQVPQLILAGDSREPMS